MHYPIKFLLVFLTLVYSCHQQDNNPMNISDEIFTPIRSGETGIDFKNDLRETMYMNGLFYEYYYNGGGVAVGDFSNDGLPDIYFISNLDANKLYINQGRLKFKEVGIEAGVSGKAGFPTGVTTVDINHDGRLDIYVCTSGKFRDPERRRNELFVNLGTDKNGIPHFEERASDVGLDLEELSTQASFFDYDRDGDLDMFLINHDVDIYGEEQLEEFLNSPGPLSGERLYRNDEGQFRNVTKESGIIDNRLSYGLGLAIGDVNNDGWPDVYVGHDFSGEDHLYINNADGTFSEQIKELTRHISNFSMGNDLADINNDGWLDIMVVDMVSEDNYGIKTSMSGMNPQSFYRHVDLGLHHQYMFNTLQLNNGMVGAAGPYFSEIAHLAGVSNTDWSWAPLLFDMDLDGDKDMFIGNGIKRDFRNNDFVNYHKKLREKLLKEKQIDQEAYINEVMSKMPQRKKANCFFLNNGDLTFTKLASEWMDSLTCSNGAAYADFDNDGDLDIVMNNMDDYALIYRNNSIENNLGNYLKIAFEGSEKNRLGIGTRVLVHDRYRVQTFEHQLSRGFQSAVAPGIHIGMGNEKKAIRVEIIWPDEKKQILTDVRANQKLIVRYVDAEFESDKEEESFASLLFRSVSPQATGIEVEHQENAFNDFERESLLPHRMSQFGPALAVADVNGDGLDDIFLGGAMSFASALYVQDSNAMFKRVLQDLFEKDRIFEDVDATFFDADMDGDLDLYVVCGGNEQSPGSDYYQDRLYENENGILKFASSALPPITTSGSCVLPLDFDDDGDIDLFIGGRQSPGRYPYPASSLILQNNSVNGRIEFSNVTRDVAPALLEIGMVTEAVWIDITGDQHAELILAGEWMPLTVLQYQNNKFENISEKTNLTEHVGWWFSINAGDFDKDGDQDLIAGNLGLNYKYKATASEPFEIYANDFDENNEIDIVLGYYNQGNLYPLRGRECSSNQMPFIKEKFPTYDAFGRATLEEIFEPEKLVNAIHYQASEFGTCYFENDGSGNFQKKVLDNSAQISSTNTIVVYDFNRDTRLDLLLAGNLYGSEVETPRNDAGYGFYLEGDGNGNFSAKRPFESGLCLQGDIKDASWIQLANGEKAMLFAVNNDYIQMIAYKQENASKQEL